MSEKKYGSCLIKSNQNLRKKYKKIKPKRVGSVLILLIIILI